VAITIDQLQIEIQAKGAESADGINALTTSLSALKKTINKSLLTKLSDLSSALDGIKAPITVNMDIKGMEQLKAAVSAAAADMPTSAANISPTVDGSTAASEMDKISGSAAQVKREFEQVTSEATKVKQELKSTGDAAGDAGKKLKETGNSAKHGANGLSKFVSSLKRILMYRIVRSILSNITSAAREGVQNLVQYSKAIGGIDASRANATMSQFASISMQVKNSLGAALMPVLNSLMPLIQTVANWFIVAANAVNQFFAAISGASTFTRAKAAVMSYGNALGGAAGAANDLKNAMLGIDELNVISPNIGGGGAGGGGGGGLDYGDMFEEVEIDSKILNALEKIQDWIDEFKENPAIKAIGEALQFLYEEGIKPLGEWLAEHPGVLNTLIAFLLALTGLTLASRIIRGISKAIGLTGLAGSLAQLGRKVSDWITPQKNKDISSALNSAAGTGRGIVDSLTDGVSDEPSQKELFNKIKGLFDDVKDSFTNDPALLSAMGRAYDAGVAMQDSFARGLNDVPARQRIISNIQSMFFQVRDMFADSAPLYDCLSNAKSSAQKILEEFRVGLQDNGLLNAIKQAAVEMLLSVQSVFDDKKSLALQTVKTQAYAAGKQIGKSFADGILDTINQKWEAIRLTIEAKISTTASKIGGGGYGGGGGGGRYAAGGFPPPGQMFIAREAGPELVGTMGGRTAVANNDQIVEGVASGVYEAVVAAMARADGGENASVNVYLDGKQINASVRKTQREKGAGILQSGVVFA
jgi:hypothetical protein